MTPTTRRTKQLTIEIFDPPMCCPSGVCGPSIDPALLKINEAVLTLKKEYEGTIAIERYLLTQQGQKFMQNPEVMTLLKKHGVEVLPVTVVSGKVVKLMGYPSYGELKAIIEERENGKD